MEFNLTTACFFKRKQVLKVIMRTFIFLFCTSVFSFSSGDLLAQGSKIIIDTNKTLTVDEIFDMIDKQTDYSFVYQSDMFKGFPKIELKKGRVRTNKLLQKILSTGNFDALVGKDNVIIIKGKAPETIKAQGIQISGNVTDSNGVPLPGANIVEKGTNNGTQTDFDGKYSIDVTDANAVLIYSYIGYATQEITVSNQSTINVTLKEDAANLDEVVVVGYGTQKKSDVTGAISQIKFNDKTPGAFARIDQAIAGKASGIQIIAESGDPGATTNVRIRGTGTLGNNQALWVIDGFPTVGNPTRNLNMNDIESIEVLKSTSAAAIYGARASNGVVIVTTKRGRKGRVSLSYDNYVGFQQNSNHYDVLSVNDYVALQAELGNDFSSFNGDSFVDWQDLVTNNGAFLQNHNINISGGGEKSNFNVSANYFEQESISKTSDFERYTVRVNSDFVVGKRLKFGESIQIGNTEDVSSLPGTNGQIGRRTAAATNAPFYQPFGDGGLFGYNPVNVNTAGAAVPTTYNALAGADSRVGKGNGKTFSIIGNVYGELEIVDNLKYRLTAGIDYNSGEGKSHIFGVNNLLGFRIGSEETRFSRNLRTSLTTNMTHTLQYENTFGKHTINLLAGYEETIFETERIGLTGVGFQFPDLQLATQGNNVSNSESIDQFALRGWLGRLNYNYDDRYLVTFNLRNDESSRFAPGFRSQTFPSFSLGWNLANESFFPEESIFNSLKLRGGWGQSGNQFTGDNFAYVADLHLFSNIIVGEDQTAVSTPIPLGLTSSDLTWEVVEQIDFGIDAQLFNNKLDVTLEYYNRQTKDILLSVIPAGAAGAALSETLLNAGEVTNKGFEAAINYRFNVDDFNFNVGGTITTIDNNVDALDNPDTQIITSVADDFTETNITQVGSPIGSFYGWVTDGIFQNAGEVSSHATQPGAEPGDIRFKDLNGDGEINGEDRTVLGKSIPGFYYGLNLGANYKNFDFTMLFQGVGDIQLLNGARFELERMRNTSNQLTSVLDRWTPQNPSNSIPRATASDPNGNARMSDRWVEDAGFLRLRNIQIGYTLPEKSLQSILGGSISSLRLYLAAQNLFTITNYSGLDPEATVGINFVGASDSPLNNGQDDGRTPTPKTFQLGLQLKF